MYTTRMLLSRNEEENIKINRSAFPMEPVRDLDFTIHKIAQFEAIRSIKFKIMSTNPIMKSKG